MEPTPEDNALHFIDAEEPQDDGEAWALSFADLMSLMAIFFMMLFTTDNLKYVIQTESKTAQSKALMEKEGSKIDMALRHFVESIELNPSRNQVLQSLTKLMSSLPQNMNPETAALIFSNSKIQDKVLSDPNNISLEREQLFSKIYQEIKTVKDLDGILEIIQERKNLRLVLTSSHLFQDGSAVIRPKLKKALGDLAKSILGEKDKLFIHVEGHTDSRPIGSSYLKEFPSNWELSTARATSIVRTFERNGILKNSLLAIGHADTKPIVPNKNDQGVYIPQNMQRNRRVEIKIFHREIKSE